MQLRGHVGCECVLQSLGRSLLLLLAFWDSFLSLSFSSGHQANPSAPKFHTVQHIIDKSRPLLPSTCRSSTILSDQIQPRGQVGCERHGPSSSATPPLFFLSYRYFQLQHSCLVVRVPPCVCVCTPEEGSNPLPTHTSHPSTFEHLHILQDTLFFSLFFQWGGRKQEHKTSRSIAFSSEARSNNTNQYNKNKK